MKDDGTLNGLPMPPAKIESWTLVPTVMVPPTAPFFEISEELVTAVTRISYDQGVADHGATPGEMLADGMSRWARYDEIPDFARLGFELGTARAISAFMKVIKAPPTASIYFNEGALAMRAKIMLAVGDLADQDESSPEDHAHVEHLLAIIGAVPLPGTG